MSGRNPLLASETKGRNHKNSDRPRITRGAFGHLLNVSPHIQYKQLQDLYKKHPNEILISLVDESRGIKELLRSPTMGIEMFIDILKTITKALSTELHSQNKNSLMAKLLTTNFFQNHIPGATFDAAIHYNPKVFEYLSDIFSSFLTKMPGATCKELKMCIKQCYYVSWRIPGMDRTAQEMLQVVLKKIEAIEKERENKMLIDLDKKDDFRELNIAPSIDEERRNEMANQTPHKRKIIHKFQDCGHIIEIEHPTDKSKLSCTNNCKYRLPCGHSCPKKCHTSDKKNHSLIKCEKKCQKIICKNNHRCPLMCWQKCSKCYEIVLKERSCGHKVFHLCSQEITEKCMDKCNRILNCSHTCKKICSDTCGDCQEIVDKKLGCGHKRKAACSISVYQLTCYNRCKKILKCGHKCQKSCGDTCTIQSNCNQPCNATLPCEHICQGTCSKCRQGRLHVPCQNQCNKPLICGHICRYTCSDTCPPCTEQCLTKCKHSECPNECFVDCANCIEQCEWQCRHYQCRMLCHEMCDRPRCNEPCLLKLKCGHQCIGLCGEDCPSLCRICDRDELNEFVLSAREDQSKKRFIQLVDCGHCIEVNTMDQWMDAETNQVKMKECPRCRSTIWISNRYGNVIKKQFSDIAKLKAKASINLPKLR